LTPASKGHGFPKFPPALPVVGFRTHDFQLFSKTFLLVSLLVATGYDIANAEVGCLPDLTNVAI
jgi:hypothetical protein